jgi:hypothetical protein
MDAYQWPVHNPGAVIFNSFQHHNLVRTVPDAVWQFALFLLIGLLPNLALWK